MNNELLYLILIFSILVLLITFGDLLNPSNLLSTRSGYINQASLL
jgi:hypothetical protein